MTATQKLETLVPQPQGIRNELAKHTREIKILKKLLRVAEDAAEEIEKQRETLDHRPHLDHLTSE